VETKCILPSSCSSSAIFIPRLPNLQFISAGKSIAYVDWSPKTLAWAFRYSESEKTRVGS